MKYKSFWSFSCILNLIILDRSGEKCHKNLNSQFFSLSPFFLNKKDLTELYRDTEKLKDKGGDTESSKKRGDEGSVLHGSKEHGWKPWTGARS